MTEQRLSWFRGFFWGIPLGMFAGFCVVAWS